MCFYFKKKIVLIFPIVPFYILYMPFLCIVDF